MQQISLKTAPRLLTAAILVAAFMMALPSVVRAQQVVVLVDGMPITALDIEQRTKFIELSTHRTPTRQEVIDGLIDEILEIKEAKRFSIEVPDSEVEKSFDNMAEHMGVDGPKLTQMLTSAGTSADTLKRKLRAQLAWTALIRGRYKASLEIADSDVEAELHLHKPEEKDAVGYEYTMRPVIFIVPRGSPDAAYETRKRDADALRVRFQNCAEGIPFARALREVAVRDQILKFSADLPAQSRDILDHTEVGHLTPPEVTAEGVQMFAICGKRQSKTDTPGMKEVREQMFEKRFGARAQRYLKELRRAAMIEYK